MTDPDSTKADTPSWATGDMPELGHYTESGLFVAGSLSTMPPFAGHHPAWALPFARDALEALSRWEPTDSLPSAVVSPVPLDGEENGTPSGCGPECSEHHTFEPPCEAWIDSTDAINVPTPRGEPIGEQRFKMTSDGPVPATPEGGSPTSSERTGSNLGEGGELEDLLRRASFHKPRHAASTPHDSHQLIEDLASALRRQLHEIDTLQDDVLRFITQRNLVCERLAARIIPGPDGQDDIDRRRLIREVSEDAWDDVDGWQEMAAKGAMVIAERDRLERELAEARDSREVLFEGTLLQLYERLLPAHDHLRASWPKGGDFRTCRVVVLRATAEGDSNDGR